MVKYQNKIKNIASLIQKRRTLKLTTVVLKMIYLYQNNQKDTSRTLDVDEHNSIQKT